MVCKISGNPVLKHGPKIQNVSIKLLTIFCFFSVAFMVSGCKEVTNYDLETRFGTGSV